MQERKISISEWPEVFSSFQKSGLTLRAYCLREGLSVTSFRYRYYHRAKGPRRAKASPAFLPVIVKPTPLFLPEANDSLVLVLPAGRRLAVSAGFDPSTLERLLDVLEERR